MLNLSIFSLLRIFYRFKGKIFITILFPFGYLIADADPKETTEILGVPIYYVVITSTDVDYGVVLAGNTLYKSGDTIEFSGYLSNPYLAFEDLPKTIGLRSFLNFTEEYEIFFSSTRFIKIQLDPEKNIINETQFFYKGHLWSSIKDKKTVMSIMEKIDREKGVFVSVKAVIDGPFYIEDKFLGYLLKELVEVKEISFDVKSINQRCIKSLHKFSPILTDAVIKNIPPRFGEIQYSKLRYDDFFHSDITWGRKGFQEKRDIMIDFEQNKGISRFESVYIGRGVKGREWFVRVNIVYDLLKKQTDRIIIHYYYVLQLR